MLIIHNLLVIKFSLSCFASDGKTTLMGLTFKTCKRVNPARGKREDHEGGETLGNGNVESTG